MSADAGMASEASRAIEAILMVAQEPIDPHLLAQLLEVSPTVVEQICTDLQTGYEEQERGFCLVKVAGGYRFQSHADLAAYVERFVLEGQSARLSNAALETLAIVAYKQPLSRAQVAAIRGVNVDGVMRTLQQRGYVVEVGKDPGPGQAVLFGTSQEFLERVGLDRIEDLPPIADLFPSAEIMEALELTLLADRPGRSGRSDEEAVQTMEAPAEAPAAAADAPVAVTEGEDEGEGEPGPVRPAAGPIDLNEVDLTDDDAPEPEPPAWAIDPSPADIDGDGQDDLPAEP